MCDCEGRELPDKDKPRGPDAAKFVEHTHHFVGTPDALTWLRPS